MTNVSTLGLLVDIIQILGTNIVRIVWKSLRRIIRSWD